ncbi:HNH endonuclease [Acidithiobacillus ferrooxidans]|uniref:HNH endonuclease n=1 Tax=Acidithiobacillus TaxID=119977 RepID=UPI001C07A29A|nr:HNH endonuclease [Acidithiobacillus ferridurans]
MTFNPDLKPGQVIDNDTLCEIFKCGPQGGMRRSKTTNSLVIVSNHVTSIYDDRWDGDVLHYTGMGQAGDQRLTFMQNRTLAESGENGVHVFLFEVHHPREYTYCGEVKLAAPPYEDHQPDGAENNRVVWMFPVKLVTAEAILDKDTIEEPYQAKLKQARRLSDEELLKRAARGEQKPGRRQVVVTQYDRSPWVVECVKRRAHGLCEACGATSPFEMTDGTPYLEVHHIKPLADGGGDTINNAAALCPNCHRRCHHAKDKLLYTKELRERIDSLYQANHIRP